ncbi:MAG: replication factor C small subunit [Candidatus Aenigmarchaeota archaeon]|nr:replication factor C small subunit [Candidatus Aenigmarchaeota archaeon]
MDDSIIWTEKYRPKSFDEVIGQEHVVQKLRAFVEKKNLPHLLFAGPAGVGKSTLALVVARTLFGEVWKENFLELNASDERGIDVVRVKVKDFARTRALAGVPFKIIFLDECDALTRDAQQALRRTMETSTATCRFILAANYSSKIIDPIQSRCAVFRFRPLDVVQMEKLIAVISGSESLSIANDAKHALMAVSEGDSRRLINLLQSCSAVAKEIDARTVYDLASTLSPAELQSLMSLLVAQKFLDARSKLHELLIIRGLSGVDFIKQFSQEIWKLQVSERLKVALVDKIGEIEFRMTEGSDEFLQLESLLAHTIHMLAGEKNNL